ncbi:MAG: ECF transporter S component [Acetobacter sp.]|nr:ECF transporter S component [Bacteroides sp.]MCM1341939.1 ECF transporter S component [Acetobacter sp.]MCM1434123.1 ECF transporter S component [Clostridiales bacterium]
MKNNKLTKMVITAMFTAMIFVLTRFVSIPVAAGYVHLGDALVYLVASVLGGPWAFFAAAVGEALADIAAGWVVYAPATLIVKAFIAIPFVLCYKKSERILTPVTAVLTIPAGMITIGGYFISDLIIDKAYAFVNIPGNIIQAAGSAVLFIVMGAAFDTAKIKMKLFRL